MDGADSLNLVRNVPTCGQRAKRVHRALMTIDVHAGPKLIDQDGWKGCRQEHQLATGRGAVALAFSTICVLNSRRGGR